MSNNDGSGNSNNDSQALAPNQVMAICTECQHSMIVTQPMFQTFNNARISVMVLPHEEPIICEGCGSIFALAIGKGSQVNIDMVCVKAAERKILIPGSKKPPRIL